MSERLSGQTNPRSGDRETAQQTSSEVISLPFSFLSATLWTWVLVRSPQLQARASPPPCGSLCRSLFGLSSQATSLRDVAKQIPNYGGCAVLLDRRRASGRLGGSERPRRGGTTSDSEWGRKSRSSFSEKQKPFLVVVAEASQQVAEPRVRTG